MLHARPEVSGAASDAMLASCLTVGNRDLEPHIPAIVNCIAKSDLVPDVIAKMSATTFVQVCRAAPAAALYALGLLGPRFACWGLRGCACALGQLIRQGPI